MTNVNRTGWTLPPYIKVEDPFLYTDKRGHWHLLVHRYDYRNGYPQNPNATQPMLVSGHAYSEDGLDWHYSPVPPYEAIVRLQSGKEIHYSTFERPHLVFDENREPIYLLNGVAELPGGAPTGNCDHCDARPGSEHSCVVCKTSLGYDWTYTLVSALRRS